MHMYVCIYGVSEAPLYPERGTPVPQARYLCTPRVQGYLVRYPCTLRWDIERPDKVQWSKEEVHSSPSTVN